MVACVVMARRVVLRKSAPEQPLMVDDIMALASCTKLLTSISAMQCIERGLCKLDDDISPILPELASLEILTGFDEAGKPMLEKRKNPITLR
jgi:CubicO group peptidase (beta-lactamase class C family)